MKKLFSLACFVAMFLPCISFAGDVPQDHHGWGNPEVKKYIKQQIMPTLYAKRMILENELTPSEKTEIAECRTALNLLHAKQRQMWQQRNIEREDGNYTGEASDMKPVHSDFHQQHREIMERLQKVADMHSTTLSGIRSDLEPQHQKWTNDITQIRAAASQVPTPEHMRPEMSEYALTGHHATTFFLLLNPSEDATKNNELKSEPSAAPSGPLAAAILSAFSISPNPASAEIVTGSNPMPADNEMEIFDIQGKKVMAVENIGPAQHIDISALATGSYVVRLQSGAQAASRQIVISR